MVLKSESAQGKIFVGGDSRARQKPDGQCPHKSLGHLLFERLAGRHANTTLFIDASTGREWTGAEILEKVLNVACALVDLHQFEPGTAVCLSFDHSVETTILALAVVVAGGTVASAYHKDPYAELLYLAQRIEPRFLFCHRRNCEWAQRLERDLDTVPQVKAIVMDEPGADPSHFTHLLDYDSTKSKSAERLPFVPEEPSKCVAFVTMSSGTTGKPKAIPVTHQNCLDDELLLMGASSLGIRVASVASLDYVSGRLIITNAITRGYTAVIIDGCEPEKLLRAIEEFKINVLYLGAATFYSMISYPKRDEYNTSSLMVVFPMGAKVIYLDELRAFLSDNPNIKTVLQGYGASELSSVALKRMTPEVYLSDPDNCGLMTRGMDAKIVDRETGQLLGVNQRGMLYIRAKTLTPGYYDVRRTRLDPPASPFIREPSAFDSDGFYLTGDIAYFNEKEELYIVGREKELMWCRGAKKVLPYELEELIEQHPAVAKVCVLGIDNKYELTLHCPRAFVVVKPSYYTDNFDSTKLSERIGQVEQTETLEHHGEHTLCSLAKERRRAIAEDLMRFVDERIGWEKQLTGGIVILDEIPTLRASGKMDKQYLRSLSLDQVEIYGDRSNSK